MKTNLPGLLLLLGCLAALAPPARAQTTVNIVATDGTAAETAPGLPTNPGHIRITRTGSTTSALTVWVKVSGTAVQGVDYSFPNPLGASVIIPAGSAQLNIPITPWDDALTEGDEEVRIDLEEETGSGTPVPYVIGADDRAEVNLLDNEDPNVPPRAVVSVTALDGQGAETPVGGDPASFLIRREGNTNVAINVNYHLGGTAISGTDYTALPGGIQLAAGVTSVMVVIAPLDDALVESTESVTLTIESPVCIAIFPPPPDCYAVGLAATASVTIISDDLPPPPTVTITAPTSGHSQPAPGTLHVTFTAVDPDGYIARYALLDGATVVTSNLTSYPTSPAAGTPFEFSFSMTNVRAGLHLLRAKVWDNQGVVAVSPTVQAVVTNIPPVYPKMSVTAVDAEAAEVSPGDAPNAAVFVISVDGPMPTPQYVVYRISSPGPGYDFAFPTNYSATNWPMFWPVGPTDYGYAYFPTGVTSVQVVVTPADDFLTEGTETLTLTLSYPFVFTERTFEGIVQFTEGGFHTPPFDPFALPVRYFDYDLTTNNVATAVILDNDTEPTPFAIVAITTTDADAEEIAASLGPPNVGVFTISRIGPTNLPLTVNYALTGRPRDIPLRFPIPVQAQHGVDYETIPTLGVATIPAGATSTEIVITPINDLISEIPEYVQIHLRPSLVPLPAPSSYLLYTNSMASLVIRDLVLSAFTPIVRIKTIDGQAIEQNSPSPHAIFRVERLGSLAEAITVPYTLTGTASNGVDYVALPGFVTLPAGVSFASIVVIPYLDGETNEPDETVIVTLQPPPLGVSPPPYVLGSSGIMVTSAGATLREDAPVVVSHPLNRFERALRLRFPSRYRVVIIPLPVLPVGPPAPAPGAPAKIWAVEASSDLVVWEEIGETEDPEDFADVSQGDFPQRFYRFRAVTPVSLNF